MNPLKAAILGIVQGLTEFLPISSSGHLVVLSEFLGTELGKSLPFDVAVHLATFFATLVYFRGEVASILKGMFSSSSLRGGEGRVGWLILLGTLPVAFVGLLFEPQVERIFKSAAFSGGCFLVTGATLALADLSGGSRRAEEMSPLDALLIGLAQAAAILPGISRSGMTISAGLWRGLSRSEAPKFAFLLSIPAVLGAAALEARDILPGKVNFWEVALGFGAAFFSGLVAIWATLRVVRAKKLRYFSVYLFALGVAVLLLSAG